MGEVLSSLQTELSATLKGVEVRSEKANLQETGELPPLDMNNHFCFGFNNMPVKLKIGPAPI